MNTRQSAFQWYKEKYGKLDLPIYTSKYFQPFESWPKKSVWFPQIPIQQITSEENKSINILCQVAPNKNKFFHLKVPTSFLKQNLDAFDEINGKIALYLSADTRNLFQEIRGKSRLLSFKKYLML